MKYSVVVAEDEVLLQKNLIKKINQIGLDFEVVGSAQTGLQAYDLVQELQPDILITDIKMPVMDGLELIKKVRDHYPTIDCIIVSGFSSFDYAKQAIHYDVHEYLLKPVEEDDLYKSLSGLQAQYRSRDNAYDDLFSQAENNLSPSEIAQRLHTYLNDHYNEDVKMSQIADCLNYSCSYLTKVFSANYNLSPSKHLISIRMQKAQQMLKHNPELTVRQIGEVVGYPEQGYFSRIFKKQIGHSPIEYRETHSD